MTETSKKTPGRNDPCHCGSGKKYKQCHLAQDEAAAREARAKEQAKQAEQTEAAPAPAEAARPQEHEHDRKTRQATSQPWKRSSGQGARTTPKFTAPRRSGGS